MIIPGDAQDLPMTSALGHVMPSSAAITPEPQLGAIDNSWGAEEHQHLMNPMFLQVDTTNTIIHICHHQHKI